MLAATFGEVEPFPVPAFELLFFFMVVSLS
jgi:hypothetical protein